MTVYTIGEAADILGVTSKALRHWESLELLQPERTNTGYRVYDDFDLERGAAIALYQGIGIPLARIAALLDASPSHLARALTAHHAALRTRRDALDAQLQAVEEMIHNHRKGTLTMEDMKQYFGEEFPAYQEEAEMRWGHTPEWEQSQEALSKVDASRAQQLMREQEELASELVTAREKGVEPGSQEAERLVEKHRASIAQWYEVTPARQLILARMYVGDERFHEAYAGAQDYLLELVTAHAAAAGVDVDSPHW